MLTAKFAKWLVSKVETPKYTDDQKYIYVDAKNALQGTDNCDDDI
jgi:hypothetical protein